MAAVTGLTLVKSFTYRGDATEEFSNTYHFKNPPPGDSPSWEVVMNQAVAAEQLVVPPWVTFVRAYGYDSDDPKAHHVFAWDFLTPGPPPTGTLVESGNRMAGDQAACVRWKTARLNFRGKPIYLRKYLHAGFTKPTDADELSDAYETALLNYGSLTSGIAAVHGGLRSRTHDETVAAGAPINFVTTRTLKRRGRRPRQGS